MHDRLPVGGDLRAEGPEERELPEAVEPAAAPRRALGLLVVPVDKGADHPQSPAPVSGDGTPVCWSPNCLCGSAVGRFIATIGPTETAER